MATFLNTDQIYKLLNRELPPDAYPNTQSYPDYYSSSSIYAKAYVMNQLYCNMSKVYDNIFPQTANDQIDDWVQKCFGKLFPGNTTLTQKRNAVINKIRSKPNLTQWQLLTGVVGLLPPGTFAQIWARNNVFPGWKLGEQALGTDTWLNGDHYDTLSGVDISTWYTFVANLQWRLGQGLLGTSSKLGKYAYADVMRRANNAFGYEVRIFGLSLSTELYQTIDEQLSQAEPARSAHLIRDNLNLSDFGLVNTVNNVDQFSNVNCITVDQSQTTGYRGLTT